MAATSSSTSHDTSLNLTTSTYHMSPSSPSPPSARHGPVSPISTITFPFYPLLPLDVASNIEDFALRRLLHVTLPDTGTLALVNGQPRLRTTHLSLPAIMLTCSQIYARHISAYKIVDLPAFGRPFRFNARHDTLFLTSIDAVIYFNNVCEDANVRQRVRDCGIRYVAVEDASVFEFGRDTSPVVQLVRILESVRVVFVVLRPRCVKFHTGIARELEEMMGRGRSNEGVETRGRLVPRVDCVTKREVLREYEGRKA